MPKIPEPTLPVPVEPADGDIIVSYSELDTYRQCPLKHLLAYKQRWVKPTEPGSPLSKGSLWHVVMEAHYNSLKADQDANRPRSLSRAWSAVEPFLFLEGGKQSEDQVLIQWMYEGYVDQWGTDEQWVLLAVEYKLQERLEASDVFLLKGKLDLIVQDRKTGHIWIVDHKSGQNLPGEFELDLDDQFGLYQWLMSGRGLKIMGAIHNAARTQRNLGDWPEPPKGKKPQTLEERHRRTPLNRGKKELDNIALDAYAVAQHAYPDTRDNPPPVYSSPDVRQCGWKCDYKEIHLLARKGRPLDVVLPQYGFEQNFERH